MLIIRGMLARENKKRDNEPHDDTYDDVWLKQTDADGKVVERRVDKVSFYTNTIFRRLSESLSSTRRLSWTLRTDKIVTSATCSNMVGVCNG